MARDRIRRNERLVEQAPKDERAVLVAQTLERFQIDASDLTVEQKYNLLKEQMRLRHGRRNRATVLMAEPQWGELIDN